MSIKSVPGALDLVFHTSLLQGPDVAELVPGQTYPVIFPDNPRSVIDLVSRVRFHAHELILSLTILIHDSFSDDGVIFSEREVF